MNNRLRIASGVATVASLLVLAGCATYPRGPSVMALPGSSSSFEQFHFDDRQCQLYAEQASGMRSAQQAAESSAVNSAAVGTMVGAAAGALIGAGAGNAGTGAAIGAGSGLLIGSAGGTDAYASSGAMTQDRYDTAYVQCMYAKGHQVPVPASVARNQAPAAPAPRYQAAPPPPSSSSTPAPAGTYPPPGTPPPPGY